MFESEWMNEMNAKHEFGIHLSEATTSWCAKLSGLLFTGGDGGELLDILLGDAAHFPGHLGALGAGGVAGGLVLALLLNHSLTRHRVILHLMDLLFGPTLGLVLRVTDLLARDVTIFDQGVSADLDCLVKGHCIIFDVATFEKILVAFLDLLAKVSRSVKTSTLMKSDIIIPEIICDIGQVTSPVVTVVTFDHVLVLSLLDHLHLVNASLAPIL